MSRHRRREVSRDNGSINSLLDGLNLSDILNILSKVDISKISSLINNSGNSANTRKVQKNEGQDNGTKEEKVPHNQKDNTIEKNREEIANALRILVNADRNLLVEVAREIFSNSN